MLEEICLEDIKKTESETSTDDLSRDEEKWNRNHEAFLGKLSSACEDNAKEQHAAFHFAKRMHIALALPAVVLPVVAVGLNEYVSSELRIIPSFLMLVSSCLVAVQSLMNYGKQSQRHAEYSGRFHELTNEIQYCLSRRKKDRVACDVTCQKFLNRIGNLETSAPSI